MGQASKPAIPALKGCGRTGSGLSVGAQSLCSTIAVARSIRSRPHVCSTMFRRCLAVSAIVLWGLGEVLLGQEPGPEPGGLVGRDLALGPGCQERRPPGAVVGRSRCRRRNRRPCRGSSRRFFRAITAWLGTGGISLRRPIRTRKAATCCVSGRWTTLAEVWLNGVPVGQHEGGEDPFVLDVTEAIKPQATNRIAVRVLNPSYEPIDGIDAGPDAAAQQDASLHARQRLQLRRHHGLGRVARGAAGARGGSVRPAGPEDGRDPRAAERAQRRHSSRPKARIRVTVAPAASGETLDAGQLERELPAGDTLVETDAARRPAASVGPERSVPVSRDGPRRRRRGRLAFDEQSTRCGFRDFRLADGYFRLNGRRIFLKSSHTGADTPVGDPRGLRSRPAAPRPAELQGDGLQHDPLHRRRAAAVPARPVRRDRPAGLRGELRQLGAWAIRRRWASGSTIRPWAWSAATATIPAS